MYQMKRRPQMKLSKAQVRGKATLGMEIRFETQNLTSYSGLILFQHFFSLIGLKERLWRCFRHLKANPIYGHHVMVMLLVVHLIIGHRRLPDLDYYRDDELVKRVLGLKRLPDVSTVSRSLSSADERSVGNVRAESTTVVLERLETEGLASVTLDFDGSVLSTGRHAEGTAVGFNKTKKGARSAFFNQGIVERLHSLGVTFSVSVPFERFAELKAMIEGRQRWRLMAGGLGYFQSRWKPKSWNTRYRFIFIRKHVRRQNKAPIQLDLFEPVEYGCEFKVIVTNKRISPRKVILFHEGRGSQEGIFAELKTHCQMGYVPTKTRVGNQLYMFAGILAHNLTRELQMRINPREHRTAAKRAALWCFREIETLRRTLIQRAGRIIRPAGTLILSMNTNARLEGELRHALATLNACA